MKMKNILLYVSTVLIWGSTWIAIEFQIGEAPTEISLFYRFAIASIIMFLFSFWRKLPMRFKLSEHLFIFLLAIMNFSINYLILYEAQKYLNSAMTSIAFSSLLLMNIINTRIFFGTKILPRVYIGAFIGLAGLVLLFLPTIMEQNLSRSAVKGLLLALSGTLVASIGNMLSVRNSRQGLPVLSTNAWGMFYGTLVMLGIILVKDIAFVIPNSTSYWLSLSYLSLFGTVIAFSTYFILLGRIGPEKASYVIVLFPMVAIFISMFVEDFQLSAYVIGGFLLVAMGNLFVLTPASKKKPEQVKKLITEMS
jgi:drug/metabolite transporter (DMT)-like permease